MARDIFGNPILRYGSSPIIPSAVRLTQSPAANPYDPRATFERDLQTELGVSPQAQRPMISPYLGRPSVARESAIARAGMTPAQKLALAQSSETARERAIRQSALGQQQQQQQQGGFFDGLPSLTSPAGQALGAFGTTALQLSGYQDRPMTIGAGLGAAMQAAREAYTGAQEAQRANKLQEAMLALKVAEASKPDLTAAQRNALSMGFEIGSPEYNDFIMKSVTKPETQIFMGGDKQKELAYKAAIDSRKDMVKQVNLDRELGTRLQQVIDLLGSGVETGRIQSALMPIKQIGRELGFLSDEDIAALSAQEIIDSAAAFLTPRMRVVGSGASSDRDMDFFARATVRLANTPEANLVIATMQKQLMDYNRKRLNLHDKYVQEKGHDFGFGDFADTELGEIYKRVQTSEQLTDLVDGGQIQEGDVFYNASTGEFDILTKGMM